MRIVIMWYTRVLYYIIMSAHVIIINNLRPAPHYETIVFPQYIYNTYEYTHNNNITCGTHIIIIYYIIQTDIKTRSDS